MYELSCLKKVSLFSKLDEEELDSVYQLMHPENFKPSSFILKEGDTSTSFYIIVEGKVEFVTQSLQGNEIVLEEAGIGSYFGELSMLTGAPRAVSVRAVTAVKTLTLTQQALTSFLLKYPLASLDLMAVLGQRLRRTGQLLRKSSLKNANEVEKEQLTLGTRLSDLLSDLMGSWRFITALSLLLLVWMAWNFIALKHNAQYPLNKWWAFDEPPFVLLNLVLAFQAAFAAPIIMMSQNRAANKDRLTSEIDHEVNVRSEAKISVIMNRLDEIESYLSQHSPLDK